jgi:protoheme IX farnesyltransferase
LTQTVTADSGEYPLTPFAAPGAGGVGDYFALLKPRVMSLVVFTSVVGMVAAPGHIHWFIGAVAILCIAVGAGASGALNMWYEADIDANMARTRNRPIPAGNMAPGDALGFATVLAVASVIMMGLVINIVSAALLALTIGFYVFIYTVWLKRRTPQNIVIGGAAGALPPVIGWAAVTGSVSVEAMLLFAIIFLWTPPHFWALALVRNDDYENAGVPMLPVVAGIRHTQIQILIYSLILVPFAGVPYFIGMAGLTYGVASAVLGAIFLWMAVAVFRADISTPKGEQIAQRLFRYSILYLTLLFAIILVEDLVMMI